MTDQPLNNEPDTGPPPPAPFVLAINTPPGMPWDQWRLARLEAENSAPLPVGQLRYDLRRAGRWRPGKAGQFAAAFFHRDQISGEVSHTYEIDGATLQFAVRDENTANREHLRKWAPLVSGLLGLVAVSGSLLLAVSDREAADMALERQRQQAQQAMKARENAQRHAAEAKALDLVGARGAQLSDALDDIGWLARARDPAASVTDVEWTPEGLTISAAGPSNPVVAKDRPITSASDPAAVSRWVVPSPDNRRAKPVGSQP